MPEVDMAHLGVRTAQYWGEDGDLEVSCSVLSSWRRWSWRSYRCVGR